MPQQALTVGHLSLQGLRLVATLDAEGSVTDAATALHLSPSTVSRNLRGLEERIGAQLVERGARGIWLTPVGRAVAQCHQRVEPLLQQMAESTGRRQAARRLTHGMLAALAAIADHRSESQAAHVLGISQSAVHQHAKALEKLLGVALFTRAAGGMRLTPMAEPLLRPAHWVLRECRLLQDDVANLTGAGTHRVVVGTLPMASARWLPDAIAHAGLADSRLQITVVDGMYDALIESLLRGDLDLIVGPLRGPRAGPYIAEEAVFSETLVVVAGCSHRLAQSGAPLLLEQLLAERWISPLDHTPAKTGFDQLFASAGLAPPQPHVQANTPALLAALLEQGHHLALVSPSQIKSALALGSLIELPVDTRLAHRPVGITVRRDGRLPVGAQMLMAALKMTGETLGYKKNTTI